YQVFAARRLGRKTLGSLLLRGGGAGNERRDRDHCHNQHVFLHVDVSSCQGRTTCASAAGYCPPLNLRRRCERARCVPPNASSITWASDTVSGALAHGPTRARAYLSKAPVPFLAAVDIQPYFDETY